VRLLVVVVGAIVLLVGGIWTLQGAYVLPATFMRGPEWVGIGAVTALAGGLLILVGIRKPRPPA